MSDLRSTVETHPNIFEVHFDTLGNHYFNVHQVGEFKFGQFCNGVPILSTKITETKTREEVLGRSRNFDTTDKAQFIDKTIKEKNERGNSKGSKKTGNEGE